MTIFGVPWPLYLEGGHKEVTFVMAFQIPTTRTDTVGCTQASIGQVSRDKVQILNAPLSMHFLPQTTPDHRKTQTTATKGSFQKSCSKDCFNGVIA